MSLRSSMKTDTSAATGGVWFNLDRYPNPDGTVPGFLCSRQSVQTNPRYAEALQRIGTREKEASTALTPEDALKLDVEVFVEGILMDWRNFEPDEDGVKASFSKEEAYRIFNDPAWADLRTSLVARSAVASNYSVLQRDIAAKNSSVSSSSTSTEEDTTKPQ